MHLASESAATHNHQLALNLTQMLQALLLPVVHTLLRRRPRSRFVELNRLGTTVARRTARRAGVEVQRLATLGDLAANKDDEEDDGEVGLRA